MYIYLQDIINHLSSVSGEKVYLNKENYCFYHPLFFNDDREECGNYLITEFRIDLVRDKKLREKLHCSLKSGDMCLGYINLDSGDYVDMESFNKNRLDYILLPFSYPMTVPLPKYTAYNEDDFINDLSLNYDVDFVSFSKLRECIVRYTNKNDQEKETTVKILYDKHHNTEVRRI